MPITYTNFRGKAITQTYEYSTPAFYAAFNVTGSGGDTRSGQSGYWQIHTPQTLDWQEVSSVGSWYLTYDEIHGGPNNTSTTCAVNGFGPAGTFYEDANFAVVDPQGRSHPLDLDWAGALYIASAPNGNGMYVNPYGCASMPFATSGWTLDGSGVFVDLGAGTIRTKDGALVGTGTPWSVQQGAYSSQNVSYNNLLGGNLYEDSNGNYLPSGPFCTASPSSNSLTSKTIGTCDAEGNAQSVVVTYGTVVVETSDCTSIRGFLNAGGDCDDIVAPGASRQVISKITLPNGAYYQFTYAPNSHGELTDIRLPTGATIHYVYAPTVWVSGTNLGSSGTTNGTPVYYHPTLTSKAITINGVTSTWNVTMSGTHQAPIVTIQDPLGNCEVHTNNLIGTARPVPQETDIAYYSSCGSQAMKTVHTDYAYEQLGTSTSAPQYINMRPIRVTTTIDGISSKVETDYETFPENRTQYTVTEMRGNPTEVREFDFGATSPSRVTDYTYLHNVGSNVATATQYTTLNIADRVAIKTVSGPSPANNGSLVILSQTTYEYDNYTSQIANEAQAAFHDDNGFPTTNAVRGNKTAVSVWNNLNSSWLTTRYQYDDLGNVLSLQDPAMNVTSMSYADALSDQACVPAGKSLYGMVSLQTNAKLQQTAMTYSSCVGIATQTKDPNDLAQGRNGTQYSFDSVNNLIKSTFPDNSVKSIDYGGYAIPIVITSSVYPNGTNPVSTKTTLDGIGRPISIMKPEGTTSETGYDAIGRVSYVTNFHTGNSATTDGATSYAYDAIGRKTFLCNPDNGTTAGLCTPGNSFRSYVNNGNVVTESDESNNSWQRTTDALGRLKQVIEPGGLTTTYSYDGLNNLTCVDQWGTGVGGQACTSGKSRQFSYDSLSRLVTSSNPETGVASYSYLTSSNIGCSGDPSSVCSKKDARGTTITYGYDVLNRLLSKAYSDQTFFSCYSYDSSFNGIGRLASEWTQSTACPAPGGSPSSPKTQTSMVRYDPMGRLTNQTTLTPGASSVVSAAYDLAGNRMSITYPDGRLVQDGYDSANRFNSVTYLSWNSSQINQPYFTVNSTQGFDAAGHVVGATVGGSLAYLTAAYDNRERVTGLTYGPTSAPYWSKQLAWTYNGNLQSQTDLITGVERQFNYDNLSRLTAAQDIYSGLAVSSGSNDYTGSTTSSGSGASETPGGTGAVPEWTNTDESNLLTDVGESSASWTFTNASYVLNNAVAQDGSMTATTVSSTGASGTAGSIAGFVSSPWNYANETMMGSVWIRTPGTSTFAVNLYILGTAPGGPQTIASKSVTVNGTWQQVQVTGINPDGLTSLEFQIGGSGTFLSGSQIQIWHPMLEDQGIAGSSVTNFLPYSQKFSGSTWQTTSATVTDGAVSAPDQTMTGASMTGNFITNSVQNPAPFDGLPVTGSVWLRAATPQQVVFGLIETNSSGTSTIKSQIENVTTYWTRFQVTGTAASALSQLSLQIGGNPTIASSTPVNVWGAQMELASTMGPYVATDAMPVTQGTELTNLIAYSQEPTNWSPISVTVSADTVAAPDLSMTASKLTTASTDGRISTAAPNAALFGGLTVTASVYLKADSGTPSVNFYLYWTTSSGTQYSTPLSAGLSSVWQRFQITGNVPAGVTGLGIQIGGLSSFQSGEIIDMWGGQMEVAPHAGPYIATTALPIITGSEPTNVLPNSQTLSGPNWMPFSSATIVTTNYTGNTAPDGTNTAALLQASSTSNDSGIKATVPNPSLYDSETVTASVYLRTTSAASQNVNLYLQDVGDSGSTSTVQCNGTGSTTATVCNVIATPTWQRFFLTATLQNGNKGIAFQIGGAGSIKLSQSVEIWGAQFVIGNAPAPYTPTNSSTTLFVSGQQGTLVQTGLNQVYSYDAYGNILQNGSFSTSYTANNQIYGDAYDAAGNLLSDGMNLMTWDAESRMATVGGATYVYDAGGDRVEKQAASVVDTIFFDGQPLARYSGGQWTDLIYGPTGLLAEVPGTQTAAPIYRVTDHLGSTVGSILSNGNFVDPVDHMPFGQVFTGDTSDPYLFTGKERDAESGLDYFGARYMSSWTGRFTSPDPGNMGASPSNPQSWNMYAYVANNPLKYVDPTGLYCYWGKGNGKDDDDPEDGGASKKDCLNQGGSWTDLKNPCHGADNCSSFTDNDSTPLDLSKFSGYLQEWKEGSLPNYITYLQNSGWTNSLRDSPAVKDGINKYLATGCQDGQNLGPQDPLTGYKSTNLAQAEVGRFDMTSSTTSSDVTFTVTNISGQASYSAAHGGYPNGVWPMNLDGHEDNPYGPNVGDPRHSVTQTFIWTEPRPCTIGPAK